MVLQGFPHSQGGAQLEEKGQGVPASGPRHALDPSGEERCVDQLAVLSHGGGRKLILQTQ